MHINFVCIVTQSLHTMVALCSSTDQLVTFRATHSQMHSVGLLYMSILYTLLIFMFKACCASWMRVEGREIYILYVAAVQQ